MFDHLTSEVRWAFGTVLGALVLSSILVRVFAMVKRQKDLTEVSLRIRTWWVIAFFFGMAIVLDRTASVVFLAFVSFLALKEYLSLIPTRRADRRVLFWCYLAIPFQYYWVHSAWFGMFIVFIPVYVFMVMQVRMISIGRTDGFLRAAGTLHWGMMTTVFSLSHAAFLVVVHPTENSRIAAAWPASGSELSPGPGLLVLLVVLTQLNDVFQFLWGKSIGNIKVSPLVSPGKTAGGLLGGVATTVLLAWIIGPRLTLLDGPRSLMAGVIIGFAGFAGDLTMSALKRDLGVKDSGSILPGHGGILDRVDSLTYTAPLFFHFVWFWYC